MGQIDNFMPQLLARYNALNEYYKLNPHQFDRLLFSIRSSIEYYARITARSCTDVDFVVFTQLQAQMRDELATILTELDLAEATMAEKKRR